MTVGAQRMIEQTLFSILLYFRPFKGLHPTLILSIPLHCFPISFSVCLSFSLLVQCPAGSSLQVLLILFCNTISVCVSSQWWEDLHRPWQQDANNNSNNNNDNKENNAKVQQMMSKLQVLLPLPKTTDKRNYSERNSRVHLSGHLTLTHLSSHLHNASKDQVYILSHLTVVSVQPPVLDMDTVAVTEASVVGCCFKPCLPQTISHCVTLLPVVRGQNHSGQL